MENHYADTAIIFIDVINDFQFDGGDKLLSHTEEILPNLIKLRHLAEKLKLPIIYVNDHYGLWTSDAKSIVEHCMNEANGHIIQQIKPKANDYFFIKPQHSAFFQTPLKSLLDELEKTQLILAGIAGDICVLFTAKDAYMHKFTMHIPKNCMASEEKNGNDYALYLMESVMKAKITPI
ncbi:isochorismatase family cysteine hydrolase [Paucisalibacillus sp. EB02]|uniref:isochorismatase family cysteine hydrolase n=1 Tax=Paucisalibacillus sp. EB02 TaxID=1347087 RepID=UPI0004AD140B|nr:isochorismatase family cysteine hydrolase [Paucisalibacillus sp. EB02]